MDGVLTIEDLTVCYNRIPAVHHLNAQFRSGSCVGLLGQRRGQDDVSEGARRPPAGRDRASSLRRPGADERRLINYVPQRETVDWDFPITVRGLAEMGRYSVLGPWKSFGARTSDRRRGDSIADLGAFANRQIKALSGGQQQRAFLSRAWAQEAEIYLLDEPFGGLDKNAAKALAAAVHRLRDSGKLLSFHITIWSMPANSSTTPLSSTASSWHSEKPHKR